MASNIKEQAKKQFELNGQSYTYYDLQTLEEKGLAKISKLPYSIRVLLESVLRQEDDFVITDDHIKALSKFEMQVTKAKFHSNLLELFYKTLQVCQQ